MNRERHCWVCWRCEPVPTRVFLTVPPKPGAAPPRCKAHGAMVRDTNKRYHPPPKDL